MSFTDYDIECIEKAKQLIDADLGTHLSIEFIAGKVGLGKTKLTAGFRYHYSMGLYSYLRKQRMIKAAELLAYTRRTIKQISWDTGFKYPSNFTKAFAGFHGVTPGKYRALFGNY